MAFHHLARSIVRGFRPSSPKPLILMYHRIADEDIDPWGNAVNPAHFGEQLQVLLRERYPLPLTKFVSRYMAGTLPPQAIALTFDDGYADNLYAAKPCLAAAGIPATVFLVTGCLDCNHEFWWDELARLLFFGKGPENLSLLIDGQIKHFDCRVEPLGVGSRKVYSSTTPTTRQQQACMEIWRALRLLESGERAALMATLRSAFMEQDLPKATARPMTRDEAEALATDDLVTIGAHSVTHPALTGLAEVDCGREIVESKITCETLVGHQVPAFAYPYGAFNEKVYGAVKAARFDYACSSIYGAVVRDCDVFALPRIHVRDWDGDEFDRKLRI